MLSEQRVHLWWREPSVGAREDEEHLAIQAGGDGSKRPVKLHTEK